MDFNGDGRNDAYIESKQIMLISNGTSFSSTTFAHRGSIPAYFINWNDDACTDVVNTNNSIQVSACDGMASQILPIGGTFLGAMDWNGDGRTDVLINSGGMIGVFLSTGRGIGTMIQTGIPTPSTPMVFDQDGDGLDDLGGINIASPFPVTYRLHNGAGSPPDLATSITNGYGVAFNPIYGSIVHGSYTKGSGATLPERDLQTPVYVVKQVLASNGIGGTYTRNYFYTGAREDVQGRGFLGFQTVTVSDNRASSPILMNYYKTAFPGSYAEA